MISLYFIQLTDLITFQNVKKFCESLKGTIVNNSYDEL
jgi:hypothetical protein